MSENRLIDHIRDAFEADNLQLPVFNSVALRLQRLKNEPSATLEQITKLIMEDQSLSSRILRMANSSFYGGLKKVETIDRAVMRLGMEKVASLAMVASQLMAYQSRNAEITQVMTRLWQRSFVSATGARWLAEHTGQSTHAEEAFLCGLLHDIGELFLLKVLDKLASSKEDALQLTEATIDEVVNVLHSDFGGRLMAKWQLPDQYMIVARDHHKEDFDEDNDLLVITRLMDLACMKLGLMGGGNPDIALAATPEAISLGIKEIQLAELEILLEDTAEQASHL